MSMKQKLGQVLVRNIEKEVIDALRLKAKLKGHSLEQELRTIIRAAVPLTPEERVGLSRKIRSMQAKPATLDSTDLIREARDSR
jgi:antitoxin FitA